MQALKEEDVINYLVYDLGVYRNKAMAMCNTHSEIVRKGIRLGSFAYYIAEEVLEAERVVQGVAELDVDEYFDPDFDDEEDDENDSDIEDTEEWEDEDVGTEDFYDR